MVSLPDIPSQTTQIHTMTQCKTINTRVLSFHGPDIPFLSQDSCLVSSPAAVTSRSTTYPYNTCRARSYFISLLGFAPQSVLAHAKLGRAKKRNQDPHCWPATEPESFLLLLRRSSMENVTPTHACYRPMCKQSPQAALFGRSRGERKVEVSRASTVPEPGLQTFHLSDAVSL